MFDKEATILGFSELMKTVYKIRKDMCCGLEIYLVKIRNQPIRPKAVYTYLWI